MNELLDAAAVDLAQRVRERRVSPVELVEAHIARIEAVNPHLNAVVADRFERARAEARAAEARVARTKRRDRLPPLLGVPCTVKEFFAVEGLPQTGGLLRRRDAIAKRDATTVRRLREAGAIVLGVTNVPEGGLWIESVNLVYGRTNNPWDLRRTAGGSSGGEAAIIAAGGSPFGLGSDIGGSIRVPAAFCGIFGHKPTGGLVPNTGQFPGALGGAGAYLVSGPMARRARDLMPLLRVLAGPDGEDPHCRACELGDPASVDLRDVVVYPVPSVGWTSVRRSMRWAVEHATHALRNRGARVAGLRVPRLRRAFEIWAGMMSAANEMPYARVLGDGEPLAVLRELLRVPLGAPRYTTIALVLAGLDGLASRVPALARRFVAEGLALRAELEAALGPNGVLLHPPYTRSAPPHGVAWRAPLDPACTCIFNVLEMPVTQVPLSFDGDGLPVGVQVVGARGRDHVTIAVAHALESAFGGWTRAEPRPVDA